MQRSWQHRWLVVLNLTTLVISQSYYSIIAPGVIKSNRKYTVALTLHDALEPATIRVSLDDPSYAETQEVLLQPYETKSLNFQASKLASPFLNLTVEGIKGIHFRNFTKILVEPNAGPKIYIQTDRAMYKPGDVVQFRVVILDEHTKPLKISEPIRVEILDGQRNRVKQFKDIAFIKGVYTGKFPISKYPVMGVWEIKVILSGKYDYSQSKRITIDKYVLPKFSVYIKADDYFIPKDVVFKALIYGKYTFDKYVEGNVTAKLYNSYGNLLLQDKSLEIKTSQELEFRFENPNDFEDIWNLLLEVELLEKHTGIIQKAEARIDVYKQRYKINVDFENIQYRNKIPYSLKAKITYWNNAPVMDHRNAVIMKHGNKEYSSYLDGNSEATFKFEYQNDANHLITFEDSDYKFPNIYVDESMAFDNTSYCSLSLKGESLSVKTPLEIEVNSIEDIPYLVYVIVGHGNIVRMEYIKVPANRKQHTLQITPSIEIIPYSVLYVHYIRNGNLYYDEIKLNFPMKFENEISIMAPTKVGPGQEVTINLKGQRKAYVSVLAVDLSVYLLDPSYDLKRSSIMHELMLDRSYLPFGAVYYPGILSGLLTLTNAHHYVQIFNEPIFLSEHDKRPLMGFRKKFPETWIFENIEITDDNTQLTLSIPDTITTWRITAFSVHEVTGFGIVTAPTDILSTKDFFISLNLPYSIKRGEILSIPILVFNYHKESVDAEVVFHNENQEFSFVDLNTMDIDLNSEEHQRSQRITVPANGIENVLFSIKPNKIGDISLRISAKNPLSSDALIQKLRVEPDGMAKQGNKVAYISDPTGQTAKRTLTVDIPENLVADSEYITMSLSGDTIVPALGNLNDLVLLPTGCGEQNMVNFAPNILVLEYLKASRRYSKEKKLVAKAKNYIDIGYQQELSFRHSNGGYSVFGERKDEEASTWLTAYVIRFFIKAEKYLAIETSIIESGLEFLTNKQKSNGEFPHTGYLFFPAHQNRFGYTAFVLMTFLENAKYASKYENTIQKALNFLNDNLEKVIDLYSSSIIASALQMAKHANADVILEKLREKKMETVDHIWWSEHDVNPQKDVEITAYALIAELSSSDAGNDSETMFIHNWLLEQSNGRGGFQSTHDTVVGLQALIKFSEKNNDFKNVNLRLQYAAKDEQNSIVERNQLTVDVNNLLVLQMEELPKSTRSLDVEITGTGSSLLQLSYRYHVADRLIPPETIQQTNIVKHFDIETNPKFLNSDEILLEICFKYQEAEGKTITAKTNMIIMEASMPSGFTTSDEDNDDLLENDLIQRIETKNSATTLVLYFEKVKADIRHCINILANKIHDVKMLKPVPIIVYDYYNNSRSETAFYVV